MVLDESSADRLGHRLIEKPLGDVKALMVPSLLRGLNRGP
jgi:hypothetical protein